MSHKDTSKRSFFDWMLPDRIGLSTAWMFGILAVLLALALGLTARLAWHDLSIHGGPDEIAAAFPGMDDPLPISIENQPLVPEEDEEEDEERIPVEAPANETPDGDREPEAPLVDPTEVAEETVEEDVEEAVEEGVTTGAEDPQDDISRFGGRRYDVSMLESGKAECGYPDGEYEYTATFVVTEIHGDVDEEIDDEDARVWLIRFNTQYSVGNSPVLPLVLTSEGPGWREVITVTVFDPEKGLFEATSVYTFGDCTTTRVMVGAVD